MKFLACVPAEVLLLTLCLAAPHARAASICDEVRSIQLRSPAALVEFAVHKGQSAHGEEEQYLDVDIDGDNKNDRVLGGCAASLQPADPCTLQVALSRGGDYAVDFPYGERFFLVRMRSRYWAVSSEAGDGGRSTLYALTVSGVRRVCRLR